MVHFADDLVHHGMSFLVVGPVDMGVASFADAWGLAGLLGTWVVACFASCFAVVWVDLSFFQIFHVRNFFHPVHGNYCIVPLQKYLRLYECFVVVVD
eukprot:15366961-Ditylum_brightwellii.AAC.3